MPAGEEERVYSKLFENSEQKLLAVEQTKLDPKRLAADIREIAQQLRASREEDYTLPYLWTYPPTGSPT